MKKQFIKIREQRRKMRKQNAKIRKYQSKVRKFNELKMKIRKNENNYEIIKKKIEKHALDNEKISMETIKKFEAEKKNIKKQYKSFEEFSITRKLEFFLSKTKFNSEAEFKLELQNKDRTHTKVELRQLERLCKRHGIDLTLFKAQDKNYIITYEVASLFRYLLDNDKKEQMVGKSKEAIKKKIEIIPPNFTELQLVYIRRLYIEALWSLNMKSEEIRNNVKLFNSKIKTPPYYTDIYKNELVIDAFEYLKESYNMDDEMWGNFIDVLQFDYQYTWRVKFLNYSESLLNDKYNEFIIKNDENQESENNKQDNTNSM